MSLWHVFNAELIVSGNVWRPKIPGGGEMVVGRGGWWRGGGRWGGGGIYAWGRIVTPRMILH